jgi:hypothetical protein
MTQGSIKHLQEADTVIMGRQISMPELEGGEFVAMEFQSTKARNNKLVHRPIIVKANLSKMNITKEEIEVQIDAQMEDDAPAFDSTSTGQALETPRDRQKARQRRGAAAKRSRS